MMCKAKYVHTSLAIHVRILSESMIDTFPDHACTPPPPHTPHSVLLLLTVMVIIVVKHLDNREEARVQQS